MKNVGELRLSSYEARWIHSVYSYFIYTSANWFAWLWSSCSLALTCRLFHLCIFLLFISENIQNVKSLPPAGREGNLSLPDPPPASQGEGLFLFSAPPPPKKSSYGPVNIGCSIIMRGLLIITNLTQILMSVVYWMVVAIKYAITLREGSSVTVQTDLDWLMTTQHVKVLLV